MYISSSSSFKRPRLKSQTTLSAILLNCETPVAERSAPGCRIEPSHLPQHNTLLRAIRCNLATRRKAPPLLRLAPTGATACGQLVAASPSHLFLSSAPPHEYTQGAFTDATSCGDAAAASPSFSSSFASLRLLGAAAAISTSLAAAAIHAWRSHGRHRVRQRSSRVGALFLLAIAFLHRVRLRISCATAASLRLLGAAADIFIFAVSCFFRDYYLLYPIRSKPTAVPGRLGCSREKGCTNQADAQPEPKVSRSADSA